MWYVPKVFGSIKVVGALTRYALLHALWNLKAVPINAQYRLSMEIRLYEIELGHHATEATKIICWTKGKVAVNYNTVIKWLKKFLTSCKNLGE